MERLVINAFFDKAVDHLHPHLSWPVEMPDGERAEVHIRGGVHLFIFDKDKKVVGALDSNDILHIFGPDGNIVKRQRWSEVAEEYKAKGYEVLTTETLVGSPGFVESLERIASEMNERHPNDYFVE